MIVTRKPASRKGLAVLLAFGWFTTMTVLAMLTTPAQKPTPSVAVPIAPPIPVPPAPVIAETPVEEWKVEECPEALCTRTDVATQRTELLEVYSKLSQTLTPEQKADLTASHAEWLKTIEACTDTECFATAYQTRLTALGKFNVPTLSAP
jgi:hypothetical protein